MNMEMEKKHIGVWENIFNRFTVSAENPAPTEPICKIENSYDNLSPESVRFSTAVLDEFRKSVGCYKAETGGMLSCSGDRKLIDTWCFDKKSKNTSASYSYDVEEMSTVFREWKSKGIRSVGFVHSHPQDYIRPSFDDIATGHKLMTFFQNDFFYLPILMPKKNGLFTLYLYILKIKDDYLNAHLEYVIQAEPNGYTLPHFRKWEENYSIAKLESYYRRAIGVEDSAAKQPAKQESYKTAFIPGADNYTAVGYYFIRSELQYVINRDLLPCFDVEKLGKYFAETRQGRFVEKGFVYRDTRPC